MSLRVKLVSAIIAMILMLGVMLTGILAAQQQTLTMTGSVTFNIADKSLYVKQVRIKQDNNSDPQVVSDFLPGYINGEFDMNIGEFTGVNSNTLGSFALYFDIINATDIQWAIKNVTLSEQLQTENVSVSYSGVIEVNELTDTDSDGYKNFDPATKEADGTLILIITAPNSSSINLSGITITLDEYVEETVYERVDEDGTPNPEGEYILFGYYPQTIKSSDVEITSTTDSRGYYLGSDGEYYAALSANPYNKSYTFSDGTTITRGTTYYFKVEPLLWRILTEDYNGQGTALVVSDKIIDAMAYQSNYTYSNGYYVTGYEGEIYANNYEYSEVRAFLTGEFYNTAFTEAQKSIIQLTTVDNSLDSTLNYGGQYVCEDTEDYVFLLSMAEAHNTDYGYQELKVTDPYKAITTSDYSRANHAYTYTSGTYTGTGWAWLRSPYDFIDGGGSACRIDFGIWVNDSVTYDSGGVVPALQIQLG